MFSKDLFRSRASAEKYIIDRTFKRPRDIISFTRFALEIAIENEHDVIETYDTRLAEERQYSQSKYKDLIIENKKQYPFIQNLLDTFSDTLHNQSKSEVLNRLDEFVKREKLQWQPQQLLRLLFVWGVIGIKRVGGASLTRRGGSQFIYYYQDASVNPLSYDNFYIHPSLRRYLNITERRTQKSS